MVINLANALARSQDLMDAPPSSGSRRNIQPGVIDLATLQRTIDHQHLLLQTLLMLLLEKKVIEDQEFKQWMSYVDGLDGRTDGKIEAEKGPVTCPGCRRVNPRNVPKCQYCGQIFEMDFLARRKPE